MESVTAILNQNITNFILLSVAHTKGEVYINKAVIIAKVM